MPIAKKVTNRMTPVVLDLVLADRLFSENAELTEGELTKLRSGLAREDALKAKKLAAEREKQRQEALRNQPRIKFSKARGKLLPKLTAATTFPV